MVLYNSMRVNHPQNVDQKCISRQWPSSATRKITLAVARAKEQQHQQNNREEGWTLRGGGGEEMGLQLMALLHFCWNRSRSKKHSNIFDSSPTLVKYSMQYYILLISSYLLERPWWSYCSYWYLWTADCLFVEQLIRNWMYTGFYTRLYTLSIAHMGWHPRPRILGNYAITG